jgi:L-iditol 2-dehydrogenase
MRAALLKTEGQLVMIDAEMPVISSPDQIIVRVRTVGVCGSEVHAFCGTHPFRKAPIVLGHEMAGDVFSVGEGVARFKKGDRVIVDPQWTCGGCAFCRDGDLNLCPSKQVLGAAAWPGAFGEYIVAPESAVFLLPETLTYAQGSLIEPLTVAVHVTSRVHVQTGDSVAILGSGSIGCMLAGVCKVLGAEPILVADVKQHCLDIARQRLGATHTSLLPKDDPVAGSRELTKGAGVDKIFVTADDVSLVDTAVAMAKSRGYIALIALLTEEPIQLRAYDIIKKELHLVGTSMCNHDDVARAVELCASGQVDVDAIATHQLPIEEAGKAMELTKSKKDGAIKVILRFDT